MNKAELVQAAAVRAEVSHRDAEKVIDALLELIEEKLVAGEPVKLSGFGIFEKKERAARIGTNPATGDKIQIPAAKSVAFKPARGLKEKLQ